LCRYEAADSGHPPPLRAVAGAAGLRLIPADPAFSEVCQRVLAVRYEPGSGGLTRRWGRRSQSEFDLLGDAESVVDLDPEIADSALQLRMPE
jgi:hypothetical protein